MTTLAQLFPHFDDLIQTPADVQRLNEAILQLAVQGKLVPQDPADEPASELLRRIAAERKRLVEDRKLQDNQPLSQIRDDEKPFELPLGWEWARFGEVVFNRDSERIPLSRAEREHRQGEYDYYGASGVIDSIDDYLFDNPLLLIGEDGANLLLRSKQIAFIARGKYWVNNHAHVLDSLNEDILQYLAVYVNAIDLSAYVTGTAQPKMNQAKMNSIVVAFPPLAEQKRIVAKVDELFAQTHALEAKLRRAAEAIVVVNRAVLHRVQSAPDPAAFQHAWATLRDHFDDLTTDPRTLADLRQTILQLAVQGKLVPQDPHDEPASELLKRIAMEKERLVKGGVIRKEKPLPPIDEDDLPFVLPVNWVWARLSDLAKLVDYGTSVKADADLGDIPILRMNNIRDAKIIFDSLKYVPAGIDELPRLLLRENDLLFNRTNSYELVGKTGIFKSVNTDYTFASYLIRISLFTEYVNPEYVNWYFNSPICRTWQIEPDITQQTGQANFNGTKLKGVIIPLPPLAEQKRIVAKVDELLARCDALAAKLGAAQVAGGQLTAAVLAQAVGL